AFLGALSGADFYVREYETETADFSAQMPAEVPADLKALREEATSSGFGLLWPNLANILSAARTETIEDILVALDHLETDVRPRYEQSQYWDENDWKWLTAAAVRIREVIAAMRDGGFVAFRTQLVGTNLAERAHVLREELSGYDVVSWGRRLSGK